MGSANFTIPLVVQSPGNVIYSAEMNAEFTNISTNFNPAGMSGYQDSLAQKQLQEDPATGLVTSLAKEVEQLRFAVKRILGSTYWYTAPADTAPLFSGSDILIGDGTKTATDPMLTLNANTGDAGVRLQVNNTSANAWDIYNDNSDSDNLKMDYNGTTKYVGSTSGAAEHKGSDNSAAILLTVNNAGTSDAGIRLKVNDSNANAWDVFNDNSASDILKMGYNSNVQYEFYTGANDIIRFDAANLATGSTPTANTLYPHTMIKAWALLTTGGGGAVTETDGFNIASASYSGTDLTVTLSTAMANSTYAVIVTGANSSFTNVFYTADVSSDSAFVIRSVTPTTGAARNWSASSEAVSVLVIGRQ